MNIYGFFIIYFKKYQYPPTPSPNLKIYRALQPHNKELSSNKLYPMLTISLCQSCMGRWENGIGQIYSPPLVYVLFKHC